MAQSNRVSGVATNVYSEGGDTCVRYHQTVVVRWNDKRIELDSGGYATYTTKLRMNQASAQFNLGFKVHQKDFGWFVDFQGETLEFFDGMQLKRA